MTLEEKPAKPDYGGDGFLFQEWDDDIDLNEGSAEEDHAMGNYGPQKTQRFRRTLLAFWLFDPTPRGIVASLVPGKAASYLMDCVENHSMTDENISECYQMLLNEKKASGEVFDADYKGDLSCNLLALAIHFHDVPLLKLLIEKLDILSFDRFRSIAKFPRVFFDLVVGFPDLLPNIWAACQAQKNDVSIRVLIDIAAFLIEHQPEQYDVLRELNIIFANQIGKVTKETTLQGFKVLFESGDNDALAVSTKAISTKAISSNLQYYVTELLEAFGSAIHSNEHFQYLVQLRKTELEKSMRKGKRSGVKFERESAELNKLKAILEVKVNGEKSEPLAKRNVTQGSKTSAKPHNVKDIKAKDGQEEEEEEEEEKKEEDEMEEDGKEEDEEGEEKVNRPAKKPRRY